MNRLSLHSRTKARHKAALLAALSLLLVSTTAWALEDFAPRQRAAAVEVATRTPSLHPVPGTLPDPGGLRVEMTRWQATGSQSALGVSMGMSSLTTPVPVGADPQVLQNNSMRPEVGVRWRSGWNAQRQVDVGAWSSYDSAATDPSERRKYNARVELQFNERRSRLGFEQAKGALGLQLSANSQMMLRAKHGRPMVYYRSRW